MKAHHDDGEFYLVGDGYDTGEEVLKHVASDHILAIKMDRGPRKTGRQSGDEWPEHIGMQCGDTGGENPWIFVRQYKDDTEPIAPYKYGGTNR